MASPAEIIRAWDKRLARDAAAARAKAMVSNDNDEPDGWIEVDGERMPFWLPVLWFFTSTRSPATTDTPSMVCAPLSVMFAVVAARTDGFQRRPFSRLST